MVLVTVGSRLSTVVSVVQQVLSQGAQILLLHEKQPEIQRTKDLVGLKSVPT
jgi:hypothetical protein